MYLYAHTHCKSCARTYIQIELCIHTPTLWFPTRGAPRRPWESAFQGCHTTHTHTDTCVHVCPPPRGAGARVAPSQPPGPAHLSSTCRLGEHLMASQVLQCTWRTLYTWPKPPEPTFSQAASSPASKVLSSPIPHAALLACSMAGAPGHRPCPTPSAPRRAPRPAQVTQVRARPGQWQRSPAAPPQLPLPPPARGPPAPAGASRRPPLAARPHTAGSSAPLARLLHTSAVQRPTPPSARPSKNSNNNNNNPIRTSSQLSLAFHYCCFFPPYKIIEKS